LETFFRGLLCQNHILAKYISLAITSRSAVLRSVKDSYYLSIQIKRCSLFWERFTLQLSEMPNHSHATTLRGSEEDAVSTDPATGVLAAGSLYHAGAPDVDFPANAITSGAQGNGQAHNNMQPFLALNYQIALQGLFPSRN